MSCGHVVRNGDLINFYISSVQYHGYATQIARMIALGDITEEQEEVLALTALGYDLAVVCHEPRLFSDNGSCYISGDLAEWLEG